MPEGRDQTQIASREAQTKRRIIMEKRRNYRRSLLLTSMILLITILTFFILMRLLNRSKSVPQYIFLREDRLERTIDIDALILRDEFVITSDSEGQYHADFPAGTRLAKDQVFGQLVQPSAAARLVELSKAESDLNARRHELLNTEEGGEARRVAEKRDLEIHDLMSRYYYVDKLREPASLAALIEQLKLSLEQRSRELAELKFSDREYNQALESYLNLKSLVSSSAIDLRAPVSGVLAYGIDGFEDVKTSEIKEADSKTLQDLLRRRPEPTTAASGEIPEGHAIAKVIHGVHQYFLAILPSGLDSELKSLGRLSAVAEDYGFEISQLRVIRSGETRQGTLLLFETTNGLTQLANQRRVKLSLRLNSERGLKVPRQALIGFRPGTVEAKLKIVQEGYVHEVDINVLDFNQDYALISPAPATEDTAAVTIAPATMVVVNPDAVRDGDPIDVE